MQNRDKKFIQDREKIKKELQKYLNSKAGFSPLYESMEKLNEWLEQKASS